MKKNLSETLMGLTLCGRAWSSDGNLCATKKKGAPCTSYAMNSGVPTDGSLKTPKLMNSLQISRTGDGSLQRQQLRHSRSTQDPYLDINP